MASAVRERDRRTTVHVCALPLVCAAAVLCFPAPLFGRQLSSTGIPTTIRIEFAALLMLAVALGIALLGMLIRARALARLMAELQRTRDLAAHREHERDLAQQELIRKLQEERELEKEKMQFQAQLSDYEKYASLAQLALGAAHEINNPLLGILSHLELELREAERQMNIQAGDSHRIAAEDSHAEIAQCIEGAKRISSAVRGLLNYARPGPLLISKISLDRLVTEAINFVGHQPMFRSISLQKRIPEDLPTISADANQLSQIVMNLLLNAAQAMPEGGRITVAADKVKFDEMIEVTVADDGTGIPADILPHVFEPFFTTKRGKGTGLGLSISQAYVRSHGGDIRVESLPGQETTVRITLPIRQEGRAVPENDEEVVV
jgi:signal transduction histidine kinase